VRRTPPGETIVTISAADPLNLTGIVTAGDRVRVAGRNRIAYRQGVPVSVREGDFVRELAPLDAEIAAAVHRALARRQPIRAAALR
jgi:ATP-dependent Lhr-like helicase